MKKKKMYVRPSIHVVETSPETLLAAVSVTGNLPGYGEQGTSGTLPGYGEQGTSGTLPGYGEQGSSGTLPGYGEGEGW
jgi:hypothetical protein